MLIVHNNNVKLEYSIIENSTLTGYISVKNICHKKTVFARITQDKWKTFTDQHAEYIATVEDNNLFERFMFCFELKESEPDALESGGIEFALCYQSENGHQHWDNNNEQNYVYSSVFITNFV